MGDAPTPWDWRKTGATGDDQQARDESWQPTAPPAAPTVSRGEEPAPGQQSTGQRSAEPSEPPDAPLTNEQIWAGARQPAGREPRNVRIRPARRFGGRGVLSAVGLLSLLVGVAVMGLLGARVLSSTGTATGAPDRNPAELVTESVESTCELNRRALDTAINLYEAATGVAPHTQDALVNVGMLTEPVEHFTVRRVDGQTVVEAHGPCAEE